MGDPRTLRAKYEPPRKPWNAERIQEEHGLLEEYGLKNLRELWVVQKELKKIRREARRILSLGESGVEFGKPLLGKCIRLGYVPEGVTLDNLLSLGIRSILDRRLETRVVKRGLARTMPQARQLITHGYVAVHGRRVNAPSYIVSVLEETSVTYFKPINLEAPVMAQHKPAAADAAPAAPEVPAEVKPPETAEVKEGNDG